MYHLFMFKVCLIALLYLLSLCFTQQSLIDYVSYAQKAPDNLPFLHA